MPIIIEENKSMRSDSVMTSSGQDLPMTENESVVLKHSEIDQTTSGIDTAQDLAMDVTPEDEAIPEECKASFEDQAILYQPEKHQTSVDQYQVDSSTEGDNPMVSSSVIDLDNLIAQSRHQDVLFNINNTISAEDHAFQSKDIAMIFQTNSNGKSMLNEIVLQGLDIKDHKEEDKDNNDDDDDDVQDKESRTAD